MAMYINTNVTSLFAQRTLSKTQSSLTTSLERLSSGLRINSAKDDAAGLAISNRMTSQIDGLNQAVLNANAGNAVAQTAGGALDQVTSILQRIRTLAVESANDSNTASDRQSMQTEVDQLTQELGQIATTTTFNGQHILDGSVGTLNFQVGANANETVSVNGLDVRTTSLGSEAGMTQSTTGRIAVQDSSGANSGTLGISTATSNLAAISSGDFYVKIDGMSSVDVAATQYGGTISAQTAADLTDVTNSNYGDGLAEDLAARINHIRQMDIADTGAGVSGTYLQGVYASATTTFTATDITDAASYGAGTGTITIATGVNDTLAFRDHDINHSATISSGTYTPQQLAAALQTALNTNSAYSSDSPYTVSYDSGSHKFSISFSDPANSSYWTELKFNTSTIASTLGFSSSFADIGGSTSSLPTTVTADTGVGDGVADSNYAYVGAGSLSNGQLNINGVDIGAVSFEKNDAGGTLTAAINAKSDETGVTASINDTGGLVLTASDGRDIILNTDTAATTNMLFDGGGTSAGAASSFSSGFTDLRITGKVTLSAQNTINLAEGFTDEVGVGSTTITDSGGDMTENNVQAVGTIANADVTSVASANQTIKAVDSALTQVNNMNATLGAIQNRFSATITNLQSISENVSSARSNMMDADFASETANLSKAQILQQAGVAMVAQANSLPQSVLSLLR